MGGSLNLPIFIKKRTYPRGSEPSVALSEKSANSSSSSETAEIILKGRGQRSDGDEQALGDH